MMQLGFNVPRSETVVDQQLLKMRARATATRTRRIMRRAKTEAVLADLLPAEPLENHSYHVISHGDVDALSYLSHVVKAWPFDYVMLSTWCMAIADIWITVESSANLNTNPRIEQTCLTRDRDLFDFYRDFYAGIQSTYKNPHARRHSS